MGPEVWCYCSNGHIGHDFLNQKMEVMAPSSKTFVSIIGLIYNSSSTMPGIQQMFSSVQLLSHVQLFATLWTAGQQASLSITNSQSSLKLMSIESVMPSNHLILCRPLLFRPAIFPSIRVFSNESVLCIRWPKYCSFSFSISLSNDYSGLISFRIDWFDHLAVQGTLKSLLQYHSSKHQFFSAQPSLWSSSHIHT